MAMATRGSIERLILKLFSFLFGGLGPSGFGFFRHRAMPVILCGFRSQVARDDALSG